MSDSLTFDVELEQLSGYEFKVRFDKPQFDELLLDYIINSLGSPGDL